MTDRTKIAGYEKGKGQKFNENTNGSKKKVQENIENLLGTDSRLTARVKEEFTELEDEFQVTIVEGQVDHRQVKQKITEYLLEQAYMVIYVNLNDTAEKLTRVYETYSNQMVFIDAITREGGGVVQDNENRVYIESPKELTELTVSIEEQLRKRTGKRVIVFDSVSTLLVYNNLNSVEKFLHAAMSKVRVQNASSVFFITRGHEEKLIDYMKEIVDKVIEI